MERRGGEPLVVLLVNKPLNVPKRDLRKRLWTGRKEEVEIQRIVRERMGGVTAAIPDEPPRLVIIVSVDLAFRKHRCENIS
jgi:hypothetical protein